MDKEVKIVCGWCVNCLCNSGYHLGDPEGICLECKCTEFVEDDYSDVLNRLKTLILGAVEDNGPEIEEDEVEVPVVVTKGISLGTTALFLGQASRQCMECGEIKLYKEFHDSKEPKVLCNFCAWQAAYEQELDDVEEQIIENELAYEEALERQEMIDECLRGLDE